MKKIQAIFLFPLAVVLIWNISLNGASDLEKYQFAKKITSPLFSKMIKKKRLSI